MIRRLFQGLWRRRGARFLPGQLLLDYEPTEYPFWRGRGGLPTSKMVSQIGDYVSRYEAVVDKEWMKKVYYPRCALPEFLFQVNNIEGEGFDSYAETQKAAALHSTWMNSSSTEQQQLKHMLGLRDALEKWCALPDDRGWSLEDVCTCHRWLLQDTCPSIAGRMREKDSIDEVTCTMTENGIFTFMWPSEVPDQLELMLERCRFALRSVLSSRDPKWRVERTLNIAASFYLEFEVIHPFMDGNGRLGRIMLARILKSVMPVPNVLLLDENDNGREQPPFVPHDVYYKCFSNGQWPQKKGGYREVYVDHPVDLAALVVEGVYTGWKRLFQSHSLRQTFATAEHLPSESRVTSSSRFVELVTTH